jgi:hypothetical protein
MRKDVAQYVKTCGPCLDHTLALVHRNDINPLPTVGLFARVHIDLMSPYTKTVNGNNNIVLMVDS